MVNAEKIRSSDLQLVICLTPLKRRKLDQLEERAFLVRKPESSIDAVKCPGCSRILENQEMCAKHLLQECLQPNNEELRTQWTKWLFNFFFYNFIPQTRTTNKTKDSATDHQSPARGGGNEPAKNFPFDLQCPICKEVVYPAEKCYNHLFKNCLRTKTGKSAVHIGKWIEEYLWSVCKSRTDYIIVQDQLKSTGKPAICKYCKEEFSDKACMQNHVCSSRDRRDDGPTCTYICTFCNLKLASPHALFNHLILRHVKFSCCKYKLNRNGKTPFEALKNHLNACEKSKECLCPVCQIAEIESFETGREFSRHLLGCRKAVPLELSVKDLYYKCDICYQSILKCNVDIHVAKHIKS